MPPSPVVSVAIRFHDDPPLPPEEVDLDSADLLVDLGAGEAMTTAEAKEQQLQVAACAFRQVLGTGGQVQHFRLPDGSAQLPR